jgi:ribosomal protein S18 acetylase RimI-like enzyme
MHLLRRILYVFKAEGLSGVIGRLRNHRIVRLRMCRLFVFLLEVTGTPEIDQPDDILVSRLHGVNPTQIVFKKVMPEEEGDIDQLTEIDPWHIPKQVSLDYLEEGWKCFVVKEADRILAGAWFKVDSHLYDGFLDRIFTLGPEEAYLYRGVTAPEFRGRGAYPWLVSQATLGLAFDCGKTRYYAFVRSDNRSANRALQKGGWRMAGRAGFVDFLCIRFHYLWGRDAFKETRRRTFLKFKG